MLFNLDSAARTALNEGYTLHPQSLASNKHVLLDPDTIFLLLTYFSGFTPVTMPSAAFDYTRPLGMVHNADSTQVYATVETQYHGMPVLSSRYNITGSDLVYTELTAYLPWIVHITTFSLVVGLPTRKYKGYSPSDTVSEATVNESLTRKKLLDSVPAAVRALERHYPVEVQAYRDFVQRNDHILRQGSGEEDAVKHLNTFLQQCRGALTFVVALSVWPHMVTTEVNELEYIQCKNTDVMFIKSNPFLRAQYTPVFPITNEARTQINVDTRLARTFNIGRWVCDIYDQVYEAGDIYTLDYAVSRVGDMPPVVAMNQALAGELAYLSIDEQCMVHTCARSPLFRNTRNGSETLRESTVLDGDYEDEDLQRVEEELIAWATDFYNAPSERAESVSREVTAIIERETDDEPIKAALLSLRAEHSALKQCSVSYIKAQPRRLLATLIEQRKKAASDARIRNPDPVLSAFVAAYTQQKTRVAVHSKQAARIDNVVSGTYSNYTLGVVLLTLLHHPVLNKYSHRRVVDEPRTILLAIKNIALSTVVSDTRRIQAENCLSDFMVALEAHLANKGETQPPVSAAEARLHALILHLESLAHRIEDALKRLED